jgi:hypothetical protein
MAFCGNVKPTYYKEAVASRENYWRERDKLSKSNRHQQLQIFTLRLQ